MKLLSLLRRDKRLKEEIYQKAMNSLPFDYQIAEPEQPMEKLKEVPFSKAVQHIPQNNFDMKEVDFYA